jgi:hypothetical protein
MRDGAKDRKQSLPPGKGCPTEEERWRVSFNPLGFDGTAREETRYRPAPDDEIADCGPTSAPAEA